MVIIISFRSTCDVWIIWFVMGCGMVIHSSCSVLVLHKLIFPNSVFRTSFGWECADYDQIHQETIDRVAAWVHPQSRRRRVVLSLLPWCNIVLPFCPKNRGKVLDTNLLYFIFTVSGPIWDAILIHWRFASRKWSIMVACNWLRHLNLQFFSRTLLLKSTRWL